MKVKLLPGPPIGAVGASLTKEMLAGGFPRPHSGGMLSAHKTPSQVCVPVFQSLIGVHSS